MRENTKNERIWKAAAGISHFHLGLLTEQETDSFTLPAGNQNQNHGDYRNEFNKGSKRFQRRLRCSFHRRGKVESRVKKTSEEDEEEVFLLFLYPDNVSILCLFNV